MAHPSDSVQTINNQFARGKHLLLTPGEQFRVSRTIVRHALVRLENLGLVLTRRNRGAFVAEPSFDEARQIFEVRRALEAEVIRILVDRMPAHGYDHARLDAIGRMGGHGHAGTPDCFGLPTPSVEQVATDRRKLRTG